MKISLTHPHAAAGRAGSGERASVLIIVLWVALGLVSIALFFAHSMSLELKAADNRVASMQAEQAIDGAARYITNVLYNTVLYNMTAPGSIPGLMPDLSMYQQEEVQVGEARFWMIGRGDRTGQASTLAERPVFGLIDESSKLNLNTATIDMLEALPQMTPELAAAIIDWRDTDDTLTQGGAESDTYSRLTPPYLAKNKNYESLDELRLVYGMTPTLLYGEDSNLNGALDMNENDGDTSFPSDNHDGHLDAGFLEYLTVFSKEPNVRTNGEARINIGVANAMQQLSPLLQADLGQQRANEIMRQIGNTTVKSVLEFYMRSGMQPAEFLQIENDITVSTNSFIPGLVNVNTASLEVLSCLPGIGTTNASAVLNYRQNNSGNLTSISWLSNVLDINAATLAGPYVTVHSYQFAGDIAAVGRFGRGYKRVKFIFDVSDGSARIVYRQDLTRLGWALGRQLRNSLLLAKDNR